MNILGGSFESSRLDNNSNEIIGTEDNTIVIVDINLIYGKVVNFAIKPSTIISPYVDLGVGFGTFSYSSASATGYLDEEEDSTVLMSAITTGVDIKLLGFFNIGAFYKCSFYGEVGFIDSFGVSVGGSIYL